MSHNQQVVSTAHDLHDHRSESFLHIQIRLSVGIAILQLVSLSLHVLLGILVLDLLICHASIVAPIQLAEERAVLHLHERERLAQRCSRLSEGARSALLARIDRT